MTHLYLHPSAGGASMRFAQVRGVGLRGEGNFSMWFLMGSRSVRFYDMFFGRSCRPGLDVNLFKNQTFSEIVCPKLDIFYYK